MQTDRETNRQNYDSQDRASIAASRGKNLYESDHFSSIFKISHLANLVQIFNTTFLDTVYLAKNLKLVIVGHCQFAILHAIGLTLENGKLQYTMCYGLTLYK